jgi:hypothetical protein
VPAPFADTEIVNDVLVQKIVSGTRTKSPSTLAISMAAGQIGEGICCSPADQRGNGARTTQIHSVQNKYASSGGAVRASRTSGDDLVGFRCRLVGRYPLTAMIMSTLRRGQGVGPRSFRKLRAFDSRRSSKASIKFCPKLFPAPPTHVTAALLTCPG